LCHASTPASMTGGGVWIPVVSVGFLVFVRLRRTSTAEPDLRPFVPPGGWGTG